MGHFFILILFVCTSNYLFSQAPGCPSIDVGDDITIECNSNPCVDLTASYLQTGETSSYSVDSISYAPPFPFTGGTSAFVGVDDIFIDTIGLPFEFCFFAKLSWVIVFEICGFAPISSEIVVEFRGFAPL